jgi:hypothetical protein
MITAWILLASDPARAADALARLTDDQQRAIRALMKPPKPSE